MIPKYEDLSPKQQGFVSGVGITLISVAVLGFTLVSQGI
jgi:hypothetical protein|tara:strand:+ start:544 stop:660 length:117 start_codon:yes stop_codon:yes gene_type:complete